jgi:hypothetical protein
MEDLFLGQYEKYLLYETPYSTKIFFKCLFSCFLLTVYDSQMFHGVGIFTYIYPKHGPFM